MTARPEKYSRFKMTSQQQSYKTLNGIEEAQAAADIGGSFKAGEVAVRDGERRRGWRSRCGIPRCRFSRRHRLRKFKRQLARRQRGIWHRRPSDMWFRSFWGQVVTCSGLSPFVVKEMARFRRKFSETRSNDAGSKIGSADHRSEGGPKLPIAVSSLSAQKRQFINQSQSL